MQKLAWSTLDFDSSRSMLRRMKLLLATIALSFTILGASSSLAAEAPTGTTPAAPTAAGADLEAYRTQYSQSLAALRAERETKYARVRASYVAVLERLQKDVTTRGDLDGAVAVKAERERITAALEPSADERKAMPPALAAVRTRYEQELQPTLADNARQEEALAKRYAVALQELQMRYAQRNELEKALAVKSELTALTAKGSAAPVAPPGGATPKVSTPFGTTAPLGGMTAASTTGNQLLAKENAHKWKPATGEWRIRNTVMTGSGDSRTIYTDTISPPFTLQFTINVLDGMRPRIKLGSVTCANEGYDTTLGIYPGGHDVFHYQRKTAYKVALKATEKSIELYVDDKFITTGPGIKDPLDKLEFCAGDGFSKGRVEYRDIVLMK